MANDTHITTTPTIGTPTVSKGQINAIKAGIRAAATSNPQGIEHGLRCAEITQSVCIDFGVAALSGIPAECFPAVMRAVAEMAVPKRRQGHAETALRDAGARMEAVLADLNRTRKGVAVFRHEAEAALIAPLKTAMDVDGKGNLECIVQDGIGALLSMPLLQIEHELDRAHEVLAVLATRLPSIGRALDERGAG